ncbi:MAG: molybdenum cofactor biosynthesis protein MoaE [Syntrophales bacterium]|nr:molybdenum cofactor biosynthesis protein MoaE [Syntrophales bacterium]
MVKKWMDEIKISVPGDLLGMILVHNGIVRGTAKDGKPVAAMKLTFDRAKLETVVEAMKRKEGIAEIRVWINEGLLQVGDDIMNVCVAGRFRTDVLPVFEALITIIKRDIVREEEVLPSKNQE